MRDTSIRFLPSPVESWHRNCPETGGTPQGYMVSWRPVQWGQQAQRARVGPRCSQPQLSSRMADNYREPLRIAGWDGGAPNRGARRRGNDAGDSSGESL
jgi:hypothetical protein